MSSFVRYCASNAAAWEHRSAGKIAPHVNDYACHRQARVAAIAETSTAARFDRPRPHPLIMR